VNPAARSRLTPFPPTHEPPRSSRCTPSASLQERGSSPACSGVCRAATLCLVSTTFTAQAEQVKDPLPGSPCGFDTVWLRCLEKPHLPALVFNLQKRGLQFACQKESWLGAALAKSPTSSFPPQQNWAAEPSSPALPTPVNAKQQPSAAGTAPWVADPSVQQGGRALGAAHRGLPAPAKAHPAKPLASLMSSLSSQPAA